jgi:ribosomal protein S4E
VLNPPIRTEHYRLLANEHRRLASNDSSTETRDYHLLMAKNFSTLAKVVGVDDNTRPANSD